MTRADDAVEWLADRLPELIAEHGVPGAQAAVLVDGEVADAAAGVLSRSTGVTATTDSVFQVGSVTKLWTASLVGQLVDEGLVDLDAPVRTYLPEFRVADEGASAAVTVRQVLSHTGGFEGDLFHDTGRGDHAVRDFLGEITDAAHLHPPGAMFSYCNSGYVVLGRLVEVLRGQPFGAVLRGRLAAPLGLAHLATHPGEAIMFRAAVGHLPGEDGAPAPAPVWSLPDSNAPAGSLLAMTARDLLGFVRMHLDGGRAPDGTAVLTGATVAAMREPQVDVPAVGRLGDQWGLGWELFDYGGVAVIGHDGTTLGQHAAMRAVPAAGVAVAVLANGGAPAPLIREVLGHLLSELAGARMPDPPAPPDAPGPVDAHRAVGRYLSPMVEFAVGTDDDGRAWLDTSPRTPEAAALIRPGRAELVRLRDDALITRQPEDGVHPVYVLVGDDGRGRAGYLHSGRAMARATS